MRLIAGFIASVAIATAILPGPSDAQPAPPPAYPPQASHVPGDFRIHTGDDMPELRIACTTIGNPSGDEQ